jgi:hypothetical protein
MRRPEGNRSPRRRLEILVSRLEDNIEMDLMDIKLGLYGLD